ncbi:helix-turn-helix transcriptional regulator [Burkholderia orbicola]|uniref:helix-turn-helix domain-containing protein n=1 Tax=Burkholderia orbicola TaxID=2978683 RepID=UPI00264DC72D|nr:helix-turn-helix transcriptional regulator [Burkholderia orbicola]MDN7472568.1 helix-turn-helix transcriptional regulator [Burkholderia orbicola]MDN7507438.1 helix-turn-helix transcriptional regulator [Burkholderia orbicola]
MKNKEDLATLAATFVATVKQLQQEAGVTDAELSRAINLDRGTLSRLLSGETTDPRLSTISAIAKFFGVPMSTLFGEENWGFVPVHEQRSLRAAHLAAAPRHDQRWLKVSNINSSRFAIALAPQTRTEPLPPNAILVIGDYESLDSGDLVLIEIDDKTFSIIKITDGATLVGFDIESTSKRRSIAIQKQTIVGKVLEIVIGR